MPGFLTFFWPQPHCPWHESVFMQGEQSKLFGGGQVGSYRARIPFGNMRLECRCAGARLLDLRSTDRNSARVTHRPCHFRCHFYMQLLPTRTCMKNGILRLPAHACSSNASTAKHSESLDPTYGMPMDSDIPLCPFWYLQWSGDIVTLDGETFLDMQVAPHQAEASKPAKQSGMYYEEHEAMDNSASTSNVAEFLGRFENANLSNVYHRSTRRKCLNR